MGLLSSSQNFHKKQLTGLMPNQTASGGNFPQTTKNNSESKTENRNQKDVIIRKQSSKSLLSPTAAANDVQPFR